MLKDSIVPLAGARLCIFLVERLYISLVERSRTIASIRWYFAWVPVRYSILDSTTYASLCVF